jgi:single stranded DNA-binding protein
MNCVKMTGRLTREPRLEHIKEKRAVCEMRLAIDNGRHPTTYIDLSVFDAPAYVCAEHLSKGCWVKVEGELRFREWRDASGRRHQRYSLVGRAEALDRQLQKANRLDLQQREPAELASTLA